MIEPGAPAGVGASSMRSASLQAWPTSSSANTARLEYHPGLLAAAYLAATRATEHAATHTRAAEESAAAKIGRRLEKILARLDVHDWTCSGSGALRRGHSSCPDQSDDVDLLLALQDQVGGHAGARGEG